MTSLGPVVAGSVLVFVLTGCAGGSPAVSLPGFEVGPSLLAQTPQLPPSSWSGRSTPASTTPLCSDDDVVQTISVKQQRFSPTAVQVIFTTTLRTTGSTPCGIPEFETCSLPGGVVLKNSHGRIVWRWAPLSLGRRCDPTVLSLLPMSIASPRVTFIDDVLPPGTYEVASPMSPYQPTAARFRLR